MLHCVPKPVANCDRAFSSEQLPLMAKVNTKGVLKVNQSSKVAAAQLNNEVKLLKEAAEWLINL